MASEPARELSSINFEAMLGGPLIAVVNAQAQAAMSTVNFIKAVGFKPGDATDPTKAQTGDPIYVSFKYPKEIAPFEPAVPAQVSGATITAPGSGYTTAPGVTPTGGGGSGLIMSTTLGTGGSVASISITNPGTGYTSAPNLAIDPAPAGGTNATATATFAAATPAVPAQFQVMALEVPILTMLPIPFIRIEETTIDFNAKINSVEEKKTDETFKIDASLDVKVQYPPLFSIATVNLKVNTSYQKNTQTGTKVDRTYSMAVHIRAVQDEMPAGTEKMLGLLEDAIKAQPAKAPAAVEA
jgi:Protein of unknown function (DUF2589)